MMLEIIHTTPRKEITLLDIAMISYVKFIPRKRSSELHIQCGSTPMTFTSDYDILFNIYSIIRKHLGEISEGEIITLKTYAYDDASVLDQD